MFLQCANPGCATPFNFRQGHLFRFLSSQSKQQEPHPQVVVHSLKHVWLCKQCCESYTVRYCDGEVVLIPRTVSKRFPESIQPAFAPREKEEGSVRDKPPKERTARGAAARHRRRKRKMQLVLEARAGMRL